VKALNRDEYEVRMSMKNRGMTRKSYDYIVIGSGSGGCVVASRLAESGANKILLIEAGPWDTSIFIRMPAALGFPLMNDKYNWYYHTEQEPYLDNRTIYEARGRVLGGSSSINGMNWVRGHGWDYDNWGRNKLPGWSYAEVLPYFKKAETSDKGANAYRGHSGPMSIETCAARNPLYRSFLKAGEQAGLDHVEDHNAFKQEGVHITQRNVGKGMRWSTSRAYLHNRPDKGNLDVVIRARVHRIAFVGKRATGVLMRHDGATETITAEREVILCGGALNSPQLLQLSGIGNARDLREVGINVVADIPGVGVGLKDHVAAPVQCRITKPISAARELSTLKRTILGARWLFTRTGLGATNFFEVGGFLRTDDKETIPNIQLEFVPMLGELQHGSVKLEEGFQYFLSLMRPESEGRVWLRDSNPESAPRFVFNYLKEERDREQMIAAVKTVRNLIRQPAWDELRGEEVTPGEAVKTDEQILAWLRQNAGTNYHPCRTCRMGYDDMAVTDENGKVHGVDNLRVIDASIMPEIVTGNLNAPVIMMAEKLSDVVLGKPALRPDPQPYHVAA
jgi:choline dehydrogenase